MLVLRQEEFFQSTRSVESSQIAFNFEHKTTETLKSQGIFQSRRLLVTVRTLTLRYSSVIRVVLKETVRFN